MAVNLNPIPELTKAMFYSAEDGAPAAAAAATGLRAGRRGVTGRHHGGGQAWGGVQHPAECQPAVGGDRCP